MKLTESQLTVVESIQEFIEDKEAPQVLPIVAFSGMGKTTLTQIALKNQTKETYLHEYDHLTEDPDNELGIVVVDYRDPEQIKQLVDDIGIRVEKIIVLAHPRLNPETGEIIDLKETLESKGITCQDPLKLQFLSVSEITGQEDMGPYRILHRYGLGNPRHIQRLQEIIASGRYNRYELCEYVTKIKLSEMVNQSGVEKDPKKFAKFFEEADDSIVDFNTPLRMLQHLKKYSPGSLEDWLNFLNREDRELLLKNIELMNRYIGWFENLDSIQILIPNIEPDKISELGLGKDGFTGKGFMAIENTNNFFRFRFSGLGISIPYYNDSTDRLREKYIQDLQITEENSFLFETFAHGGCSSIDSPEGVYLLEYFLQDNEIEYIIKFIEKQGSSGFLEFDGKELRETEKVLGRP